jgi:hypothetical protein
VCRDDHGVVAVMQPAFRDCFWRSLIWPVERMNIHSVSN